MKILKYTGLTLMTLALLTAGIIGVYDSFGQFSTATVVSGIVVQDTNAARGAEKLTPLTRNNVLDKAATLKAQDMLAHQYFSHRSPTGVTPWHWFEKAGYTYLRAGENLAVHFSDSHEVVDAWLNSPSHRVNIMNGAYAEIGIGMATGTFEGVQTTFVVQLFGTRNAKSKYGATVSELDKNEYRVISESVDITPSELATIERTMTIPRESYTPTLLAMFAFGALCISMYVFIYCARCSCSRTAFAMLPVMLLLAIVLFFIIRTGLTSVL